MVKIEPEPRKEVFMSIAITPEMKEELKKAAKALRFNGVSELMRVLAKNFLDGKFDGIEFQQPERISKRKPRKSKGKKSE